MRSRPPASRPRWSPRSAIDSGWAAELGDLVAAEQTAVDPASQEDLASAQRNQARREEKVPLGRRSALLFDFDANAAGPEELVHAREPQLVLPCQPELLAGLE